MSLDARNSKELKHNSLSRVVSAHLFIMQSVTCVTCVVLYTFTICVCGLKQLEHYSKQFLCVFYRTKKGIRVWNDMMVRK